MTATETGADAGSTEAHARVGGDGAAPGTTHPAPDAAPEELGATDALPRLFKVFGGIIAPTSLHTALLFYFGRSRAAGYYRYFHVNSTVLDLSTNDYLFSGVDGLFVPVAEAALLALVLLWLNRLLLTRVPSGARRRPRGGTRVSNSLFSQSSTNASRAATAIGTKSPSTPSNR